MGERRYSESEVAAILSRLAESEGRDGKPTESEGVTLHELQKIAAELGIDESAVTRAALNYDKQTPLLVAPNKGAFVLLDETIDGDMDEELWTDVITALTSFNQFEGFTRIEGKTREWNNWIIRELTLRTREQNGRTRFRLEAQHSPNIGCLTTALIGSLLVGAGVVCSLLLSLGTAISIVALTTSLLVGGSVAIGYGFHQMFSRKRRKKLEGIVGELAIMLRQHSSVASRSPAPLEHLDQEAQNESNA
ncbi:MAG: hypothetical protein KF784_09175 [Fimbriimonadaceae bacterium]|nr:hypothetical protein [Fimbriimonadaceae bacterium]